MMPMATLSVTEDMATCMRLHAHGLALGLPPRGAGPRPGARRPGHHAAAAAALGAGHPAGDAQGEPAGAEGPEHPAAAHVLLDDVELPVRASRPSSSSPRPFLYLVFGVLPVKAYGLTFLAFFVPYIVVNQLLFLVVGYGKKTWRGHQYSLALFPLWIRACWTAAANVWFHRPLGFVVTPKTTAPDEARPLPVAPRGPPAGRGAAAPGRGRHRWRATVDRSGRQRHRHRREHRRGSRTTSWSSASSGGRPSTGGAPRQSISEKEHSL